MKEEIWLGVEGYEELYQVSNLGRVKSLKYRRTGKEKLLTLLTDKYGYLHIKLCRNYQEKSVKVHRLIAKAFIPNLENKKEVNHIDGIKANNHVSNLEWATRSENMKHAFRTGLWFPNPTKGEEHYQAKLSKEEVHKICTLYWVEGVSQSKIAKIFNCSQSNIWSIVNGKNWVSQTTAFQKYYLREGST
jgi:predicted DNA-binding protein (UPF0251 family)